MNKKATIVCLPSNEIGWNEGDIIKITGGQLDFASCHNIGGIDDWCSQHLYLVCEDDIKEEDWYYFTETSFVRKSKTLKACNHPSYKKILATTDKSLNLPGIPQSFLQSYVQKQGGIKEVELEMQVWSQYDFDGEYIKIEPTIKLTPNNEVSIVYESPEEEEGIFGLYDAVIDYRDAHPEAESLVEAIEFAEWLPMNAQPIPNRLPHLSHVWVLNRNKKEITSKELYNIWKANNSQTEKEQ